jgi:hypothetical protein
MGFGELEPEPIILLKPEPEPAPAPAPPNKVKQPIKLSALPEEVSFGEVFTDTAQTQTIARPWLDRGDAGALVTTLATPLPNRSTPSAFRDQLGLDPDPVLTAEDSRAFQLVTAPSVRITEYIEHNTPLVVRFKPNRAGETTTIATVKAIGSDGSIDTRQIRLVGIGKNRIVNEVHAPDVAKGLKPRPADPKHPLSTTAGGAASARAEATYLASQQKEGVALAEREISSFSKAPPPKSEWSWMIDLAISMGVSGIAAMASKFLAKALTTAVARNSSLNRRQTQYLGERATAEELAKQVPGVDPKEVVIDPGEKLDVNEHVTNLVSDAIKEGMKGIAKRGLSGGGSSQENSRDEQSDENEAFSSNVQIDFFTKHAQDVNELQYSYARIVNELEAQLSDVDPQLANNALVAVAHAFNEAAPNAVLVQARATEYQWVSATAKRSLGARDRNLPDGSKFRTTNLDGALSLGERGPFAPDHGTVPEHDGVLDIHVEVPEGAMPVETTSLRVRSASLLGISQEIADRLRKTDLDAAGIPLRIIVHGQPALITRDEIGNVRVNGYLHTLDGTNSSEAHTHKGARMIVNKILSKTLDQWGIRSIKTNDASGTKSVGT